MESGRGWHTETAQQEVWRKALGDYCCRAGCKMGGGTPICRSTSIFLYLAVFVLLPSLLQTGRTGFMCLQTYQRFASDSLKRCSWTTAEDTLLKELVEKMRIGNFIPYTQSKGNTQSWHHRQSHHIRVMISESQHHRQRHVILQSWHHRQPWITESRCHRQSQKRKRESGRSQDASLVTHSNDMQNTWIQHSNDITCMLNW